MPTLQICSAQPDNQIIYVTNDNVTDVSNQDYSSYESSAYPSSYRSSSSYELYDASSGSQSLGVSEYASGFDDYGSSYGSAEDGFQINVSNSHSRQLNLHLSENLAEESSGSDMILNMCCGCIENLELLLGESLDVKCSSKGSTDILTTNTESGHDDVHGTLSKLFIQK